LHWALKLSQFYQKAKLLQKLHCLEKYQSELFGYDLQKRWELSFADPGAKGILPG
jgi:hypothetical protein